MQPGRTRSTRNRPHSPGPMSQWSTCGSRSRGHRAGIPGTASCARRARGIPVCGCSTARWYSRCGGAVRRRRSGRSRRCLRPRAERSRSQNATVRACAWSLGPSQDLRTDRLPRAGSSALAAAQCMTARERGNADRLDQELSPMCTASIPRDSHALPNQAWCSTSRRMVAYKLLIWRSFTDDVYSLLRAPLHLFHLKVVS